MHQKRKNMPYELRALQDRLRALLRANMGEARRTRQLLGDIERKLEEQFGHLGFIESSWYIAGKKFRKEAVQGSWRTNGILRGAENRSTRNSLNMRGNAPSSADQQALGKSPSGQNIAPRL